MPKSKKVEKKPELDSNNFADYGDFIAAKKVAEVKVEPKVEEEK